MMQNEKQIIRERIITLLRNQEKEKRLSKSLAILGKFFQLQEFNNSLTILFYAAFAGEVDTFEMIKRALNLGKKICLPKIVEDKKDIIPTLVDDLKNGLENGHYGIKQTKNSKILDMKNIDMIVVPGIAFDKNNNRLGRGGGYYDRFLKRAPLDIPTIGLAFDFQIVDNLPLNEYDVSVNRVLTN